MSDAGILVSLLDRREERIIKRISSNFNNSLMTIGIIVLFYLLWLEKMKPLTMGNLNPYMPYPQHRSYQDVSYKPQIHQEGFNPMILSPY
jgi:hypothetical protein